MKKFFGLFLLSVFSFLSFDAEAQFHVSSKGKPIMKGDSVLIHFGWTDPNSVMEKVELEGFYSPDETELKSKQFAMYVYPKATRKFRPQWILNGRINKMNIIPMFIVVVLDENGDEIRDEYSDVENAAVDFRKLDVAGKTYREVRDAYGLKHKEIITKNETVEQSAAVQKSQTKGKTKKQKK